MNEILIQRPDQADIEPQKEHPFEGLTVVTIGGGRGIGAATALAFARRGANSVVVYRGQLKEKRYSALKEFESIGESTGVGFELIPGDITDETIQDRVLEAARNFGSIFVVNINAAGGAIGEEEAARRLNVEMPQQIVEKFLPHMAEGGVIIYPSSLWSTHEDIRMLPGYRLVAETKHKAEDYLISQIDRLSEYKVSLRFICGHAVSDTDIIKFFKSRNEDAFTALEATAYGGFPTTEDMAKASVYSVRNRDLPSGARIYVLGKGQLVVADKQALENYIETINTALEPSGFEK